MSKKQASVRFEVWRDPYGENMEDVEWPGFNKSAKADSEPDRPFKDSYEEAEHNASTEVVPTKPIPFVATNMGIIPLTEYSRPSKVFNFWVGHTNFNISKNICKIIEETEGVEIFNVFTRYRFRIGIGKLWNSGDVMRNVKQNVIKHIRTLNAKK